MSKQKAAPTLGPALALADADAAISHHLKVLREAGLIDCERRGTWVCYWIVPMRVNLLAELLKPVAEIPRP